MPESNTILNAQQIQQKIRRIAYQIYEVDVETKKIFLIGIYGSGQKIAELLKKELEQLFNIEVISGTLTLDKKNPRSNKTCDISADEYQNQYLVLVDDVLNSGTTLMHAAAYFLDVPLKRFKTAVLVDRNHKKYPIKVDFKGLSLSTSLNEHVEVLLNEDDQKVIVS